MFDAFAGVVMPPPMRLGMKAASWLSHDPHQVSDALAEQHGKGTLSTLFGDYSDNPAVQQVVAQIYADRWAANRRMTERFGRKYGEGPGAIDEEEWLSVERA